MVNDSLGGYCFTEKDGKIAYYKEGEGADSAVPFSSGEYYLLCDNASSGGTYTISENVYPSRLFGTSSAFQSKGDVTLTKEQYDASGSSNKITISNYGNQTAYLYKVNDTSFKIEASNMMLIVVLGSGRG